MVDTVSLLRKLPLQRQLDESQWWPAHKLRTSQFQQLNLLLQHVFNTVPVMQERLAAAGYRASQSIDYQHWLQLPVLTRTELQSYGRELISRRIPPEHGAMHEKLTSGSTGKPVLAVGSALSTHLHNVVTLRYHLWHGHDFAKSFAIIKKFRNPAAAYPGGIAGPRWGDKSAFPFATGPAAGLSIESAVDKQLAWLRRIKPDYLLTYPSNLAALIDADAGAQAKLKPLKGIVTIGELLADDTRKRCAEVWQAPLADIYSAQEAGYIAVQCPVSVNYHIQAELIFVEILDDNNQPCRPGQTGRVIVTPMHNYAMPLIRYEIGDYAQPGDACGCGRGLPVIRRILGRVRNMLILPDGQRFWPSFGSRNFTEIAPIIQFQFVQKSFTRLEARLVVERALTRQEETHLRRNILTRLPAPFTIDFHYVTEIERSAGGKFEDFKCEIDSRGLAAAGNNANARA